MSQQTPQQKKAIRNTVLAMLAIVAFAVFSLWYKMQKPLIIKDSVLPAYGAYVFETPRLVKAFELLDKDNNQFAKENLKGEWSLVFFGFTNCPDICPTTLSLFKQLKTALKGTEVFDDTQFVMVTVDPARDTPEKLKEYVEYFDPEFNALTGEFLSVHSFATNVNAAFKKILKDDDYTIDHTGNIIILNEYGDYQGFFKPPFDVTKMTQAYRSIRYTHRR